MSQVVAASVALASLPFACLLLKRAIAYTIAAVILSFWRTRQNRSSN